MCRNIEIYGITFVSAISDVKKTSAKYCSYKMNTRATRHIIDEIITINTKITVNTNKH